MTNLFRIHITFLSGRICTFEVINTEAALRLGTCLKSAALGDGFQYLMWLVQASRLRAGFLRTDPAI